MVFEVPRREHRNETKLPKTGTRAAFLLGRLLQLLHQSGRNLSTP
jgi:hypothetical protein